MKSSGGLSTFVIESSNVTGWPSRFAAISAMRLWAACIGIEGTGK